MFTALQDTQTTIGSHHTPVMTPASIAAAASAAALEAAKSVRTSSRAPIGKPIGSHGDMAISSAGPARRGISPDMPPVALDLRNRPDTLGKSSEQPNAGNSYEQGPDERDQWAERQAITRSMRICSMQSMIVCLVLRSARHPVAVVNRPVSGYAIICCSEPVAIDGIGRLRDDRRACFGGFNYHSRELSYLNRFAASQIHRPPLQRATLHDQEQSFGGVGHV
nr:hypothetical protein [Mesorhizobium sp.]